MTPGTRLKEARLAAGYATAHEAAAAADMTPSTYMGHENGSRGMNTQAAMRYGKLFRVNWAWLLSGEGANKAPEPEESMRLYTNDKGEAVLELRKKMPMATALKIMALLEGEQ
jgi:transcriptional regulator with XRE-family HTH domain